MAASLSALIRRGFEDATRDPDADLALRAAWAAEPAFQGLCLQEISRLMHRRSVPAQTQDQILAAAIRSYRAGCRRVWGPVLLAMLGPALVRAAACLQAVPPGIEEEDIDQQVVLEALRAAAQMPLPDDCRYVQRRLLFWAIKPVRRSLEREVRRQSSQRVLDDVKEVRQ